MDKRCNIAHEHAAQQGSGHALLSISLQQTTPQSPAGECTITQQHQLRNFL